MPDTGLYLANRKMTGNWKAFSATYAVLEMMLINDADRNLDRSGSLLTIDYDVIFLGGRIAGLGQLSRR